MQGDFDPRFAKRNRRSRKERSKVQSAPNIWMPIDKSEFLGAPDHYCMYAFGADEYLINHVKDMTTVLSQRPQSVTDRLQCKLKIIVIVLRNPLFLAGAGLCRQPNTAKMRCPQIVLVTPR